MMRVILLLFLVTLAFCQTNFQTWTAQTIVTSPQMGSGYFTATVKYDWPAGMMEVAFQDFDYKEFYVFNKDKGYNKNVATGQFTYQYMYKTSAKCPCEILGLQKAMPAWFPGAVSPTVEPNYGIQYWPTVSANNNDLKTLTGASKSATLYAANTNFKAVLPTGEKSFILSNSLWLNTDATKSVAGFQLTDPNNQQRTFTITSLTQAATATLGLTPPSSSACPCRKLVDIVISMDRSGSISYDQWLLEYQFIQNLANSFEYGADGANFGIGNWNAQHWRTIELPAGNSRASVMNAVNSMKCCDTAARGEASCCCCGTPIGGGIYLGGQMLMQGRPRATKVLIVLTDGCQNHLWVDQPTPKAIQCACANEKVCAANKTCTGDITKWYQIVTTQYVPGTKVIAIGVGGSDTVCRDQLVMAAGNDETNVYNPDSWAALQTIVQTISATACTITATPCDPSCCGLCTCGQCIPAPKCFNPDKCTIGTVDNTTKCCTTLPVTCPPKACNSVNCDPAAGCTYNPLTCKANETCTYWYCDSKSQICTQAKKPANELPAECNPDIVVDECVTPDDCGTSDPCKKVECFKLNKDTPATCRVTQITCPPSDNCTSRFCRPGVGCVNTTKTCNDYSLCTTDKCVPDVLGGCVFTPIADCPQPADACKKAICVRDKGCIEVPVNCSERGYVVSIENCTIPACNKTCFNQYVCFVPPPTGVEEPFPTTVVLISALSTAAIVGIVVAAAVLVVGLGGAAGVAIAGAAGAGGVALVAQNPIYAPSGASGTNALFKDQS